MKKIPLSTARECSMLVCMGSLMLALILWAVFRTQTNWYSFTKGPRDGVYSAVVAVQYVVVGALFLLSVLAGIGYVRLTLRRRRAMRTRHLSRWGIRTAS